MAWKCAKYHIGRITKVMVLCRKIPGLVGRTAKGRKIKAPLICLRYLLNESTIHRAMFGFNLLGKCLCQKRTFFFFLMCGINLT